MCLLEVLVPGETFYQNSFSSFSPLPSPTLFYGALTFTPELRSFHELEVALSPEFKY